MEAWGRNPHAGSAGGGHHPERARLRRNVEEPRDCRRITAAARPQEAAVALSICEQRICIGRQQQLDDAVMTSPRGQNQWRVGIVARQRIHCRAAFQQFSAPTLDPLPPERGTG